MIEASNTQPSFASLERNGHDMPDNAKSRLDYLIRRELGHKLRAIYAAETSADPQMQSLIAKLEALLVQNSKPD